MGTTPTYLIPYPEAADPADVPTDIRELAERVEAIHAALASQVAVVTIPSGTIAAYGGSAAPTGWLLCDGSAVSRTGGTAALFAALGTAYGTGNGTSTFNLPNLKGRVPIGRDAAQAEFDTLAEAGGAKTHALTVAEMPAHAHTALYDILQAVSAAGPGFHLVTGSQSGGGGIQNTGGSGAHNNMPPYQVVNYIVKT